MKITIKNRKSLLLILLLVGTLFFTPVLFGCGPTFPTAMFTYQAHPDLPLDKYSKGELGVISPTYARSYLVVAYRYLIGNDLNPAEQKAVLELWKERFNIIGYQSDREDLVKVWTDARKKVDSNDLAKPIEVYKTVTGDHYLNYLNCNDDAFRTATETLNKKIEKFGAQSPEV